MDIKHVLLAQPAAPGVRRRRRAPPASPAPLGWCDVDGGLVEVGHEGDGFSFDNELPAAPQWLAPYRLADRLVTNGEWLEFIDDGGYRRPELWLSDGWARVTQDGWRAPSYWIEDDGRWFEHTLHGTWPVNPGLPVCHVSHYEADAYATLGGEAAADRGGVGARRDRAAGVDAERRWRPALPPARRPPRGRDGLRQLFGDVLAVDRLGLPALPRLPARRRARSASTTASSCPARWCCGAAPRSPRRGMRGRPTGTSSRPAPGGR